MFQSIQLNRNYNYYKDRLGLFSVKVPVILSVIFSAWLTFFFKPRCLEKAAVGKTISMKPMSITKKKTTT